MNPWSRMTANLQLPIRAKLLIWFSILLFVMALTLGYFAYKIASEQVVEKISQSQENIAQQVVSHMDVEARSAINFSNFLFLSDDVKQYMRTNSDTYEASVTLGSAYSTISKVMVAQNDIQSLVLYPITHTQPLIIHLGQASAMPFDSFRASPIYAEAMERDGAVAWDVAKVSEHYFIGDKNNKLVLARIIKDSDHLDKTLGILVLGINETKIRKGFANLMRQGAEIIVTTEDGRVIVDSNSQWFGRSIRELPYFEEAEFNAADEPSSNEEWLLTTRTSELTGWKVFIVQPKKELLRELNAIGWITAIVFSAFFLISLGLSWYFASTITRPIKFLLRSMNKLQRGDFEQRVDVGSRDEIGQLGRGYNVMVERMKQLIDHVYRAEIKQKEAELGLLQSQINPHFLYNTLNLIFWLAEKHRQPEISHTVLHLSQVFQLTLSDGRKVIPIRQEIQLVTSYLEVQKKRFGTKLSYEVQMQEQTANFMIPKLLLQPLVENCIIHGIEPSDRDGLIQIIIERERQGVRIQVIDNGVGMDEVQIQRILSAPAADGVRRGFALRNVQERILLYFGSDASLTVTSKPDMGTKIVISCPSDIIRNDEGESS